MSTSATVNSSANGSSKHGHDSAVTSQSQCIVIDGSRGEGGGQILRNSISFAGLLGKDLHVQKIRAGRSKPGLKAQHVAGLRLVSDVCGGKLSGDAVDSVEIRYQPQPLQQPDDVANEQERTLTGEIKTAGSICLLLQAALPCALLGSNRPCRLILKGGTNASMAPQYDYWERVVWPTLRNRCGLAADQVRARVVRRGYFPKGGGEVNVRVQPLDSPIRPIHLTDRGEVAKISIRSFHAGKVPRYLAEKMARAAKTHLQAQVQGVKNYSVEIVTEKQAVGSGLGILIVAETSTGCLLAGSALSSPKQDAKKVGIAAAQELCSTLQDGGCVDEWLQDQLVLFMALADGTSEILTGSLTLHTRTAIWIAQDLSGAKFHVAKLSGGGGNDAITSTLDLRQAGTPPTGEYGHEGRIGGRHLIRCEGIGYWNNGVGTTPTAKGED